METRVLGRYLVVGGLGGACGCVLWWFTFYSSVIANTGGSPGDVGRAFECLFHSPMPCEIVKGLSRIAGYWPYEPFLLWLSAAAAAVGAVLQSTSVALPAVPSLAVSSVPPQAADHRPSPPSSRSRSDRWLLSSLLPNGRVIKIEINPESPRKLVGRDPRRADVVIDSDSISRAHALFELENGCLWIRDLGSTNGTKVGGARLSDDPLQLQTSDEVEIGAAVKLTVSAI